MITTLTAIVNTLTETGVNDYSVNFKITDKAHVYVYYVDGEEPEVELVRVESFTAGTPNEYKVNAITDSGFNVELRDTYAAATGRKLSIRRIVPFTQEVEYPPGNDFPGATHERALDKLTAIIQQFNEEISRTISLPLSEDATDLSLPAYIPNYYLGLDGSNNLIWKVGTVAVGNDEIKDSHIDWGLLVNQVSAEDIPIRDTAGHFSSTEIESALAELQVKINNTAFMPVGSIIMFDANKPSGGGDPPGTSGAWVDNVTLLNWYACIAANSVHGCPDMTDRFAMGKVVAGAGATGGSNTHTISSAELPVHTHAIDHDHASKTSGAMSGNSSGEAIFLGGPLVSGSGNITVNAGPNNSYRINSVEVTGTERHLNLSISHTHDVDLDTFIGDSGDGGFANSAIDTKPAYYTMIFIRKCD